MKKYLLIFTIIIALLLLLLVGYYAVIKTPGSTDSPLQVFKGFLPFGGSENTSPETNGSNDSENETSSTTPEHFDTQNQNFSQKVRKISNEQISGVGSSDTKAGTTVRYILRATGHIYEADLFSPRQVRISNTTIPNPYEAYWNSKNDIVIARYLKENNETIDTYSISLKNTSTTTESTLTGKQILGNISDIAVLGNSIFYVIQDTNSSSGYVSNFDGTKPRKVWGSNIKELLPQFINEKTVALTTKPAPDVLGYLYTVDVTTGATKKILGGVPGLSTLVNPTADKVLYLAQTDRAALKLFDIKTLASIPLTPATFPDKCVWSVKNKGIAYCAVPQIYIDGTSLTSWYLGKTSFTDDIWRYDTLNNTSSLIENLSTDAGEAIDVIRPQLSQNEQYLIFINKTDNSLWSLDLAQIASTTAQ